jgi:hypothetical protein
MFEKWFQVNFNKQSKIQNKTESSHDEKETAQTKAWNVMYISKGYYIYVITYAVNETKV